MQHKKVRAMHPSLKEKIYVYWNKQSCGTEHTSQKKFSPSYFEQIEQHRYTIEPEVFSFAQFTRFHNKKILEVGVGAGTDFIQWARAGAQTYGIDMTPEAIENTKHRLEQEMLAAQELHVADAEAIPYPTNFFDCVYSWGVIHHSPDTMRCLREIIRVTKPGGTIKIMIYNRYSLFAFYQWLRHGNPLRSITWVLYHHQESPGTKAFTIKEIKNVVQASDAELIAIKATATQHDLLYYKSWPWRLAAYLAACILGWNRCGWFMTMELKKKI